MDWPDYMKLAAHHSKNSAKLWFRYLRKYVDKCDTLFSLVDVERLYHSDALTPFQRVSIKAAFTYGSQTRQHIISLNQKVSPSKTIIENKYISEEYNEQ